MRQVQTSLLPFHLDRKTILVDEGMSVERVIDSLFPQNIKVQVMIDDKTVERELWAELIPPLDSHFSIIAIPAGGKGKNPLAIILMLAVVVAAAWAAPILLAGTALAGSAAAIAGVTAAIGAVGSLLVSMIASTPLQSSSNRNSDVKESTTQFIEGASNAIDPYGVIPINLGTNRMFPKQAARPYTETSSNLQYVRQLFTYGFGKHVITDRKFGETPIGEYSDIDLEDKLNGDLSDGTSIYSNDVYQESISTVVAASEGYILRTTQTNSNEAEMDLTFGRGLTIYNDAGNRTEASVEFELQFAPTGTSDWSSGSAGISYSSKNVTIPSRYIGQVLIHRQGYFSVFYRNSHVVFLNYYTGEVVLKSYTSANSVLPSDPVPPTPYGHIRIASILVTDSGATVTDERINNVPEYFADLTHFTPSVSSMTLTIGAGTITSNKFRITASTAEPLRISKRMVFPSAAQYDVRIKRLTADSVIDKQIDECTLTALKSIRYIQPVAQEDISGTAMRILGTDQLNGSIQNYNVICSTIIPFYDVDTDSWVEGVSSDPASIYRYVLQCDAFVESKRLPDARINISKLEEWSDYCREKGLTYNRVIDYEASIDDVLNDICAAGMATKHYVDGVYSVIVDNERDTVKGLVTPRNSWGYKGIITYPELPHAFRVEFRNPDKGYQIDERIVYQDGYNESNATDFERIELSNCTSASLAYYYARRYLATLKLQPEVHTFNMDFENLAFNRGDRIQLVNDVVLVGVGQGRITALTDNGTHVTSFTIDETLTIPTVTNFGARIRHADGSGCLWYEIVNVPGERNTFTFVTPVLIASAPGLDSLCAFTDFSSQLDLVVSSITLDTNHNAQINAINYAPSRFNADTEVIPDFTSNIIQQIGAYTPDAPILNGEIASDETVMSKNSDGSYTSRMIINLTNTNEATVQPIIKYQRVGDTLWSRPDTLIRDADRVVLTNLEDGKFYNFEIRYQRQTGQMLLSQPLRLNNVKFLGASSIPDDVSTFKVSIIGATGYFNWTGVSDVDLSHYVIRHSSLTSGATRYNSQIVRSDIKGNSIALPIQVGTYLIYAVDILGNESASATTIVNFNSGVENNLVTTLIQEPTWSGTKVNCHVINDQLYLIDPTEIGYYYFTPSPYDLGDVYDSIMSAKLEMYGSFYLRVRDIASIRSVASFRGTGGPNIRSLTSVRSVSSLRGIDQNAWFVTLQISTSEDNITYTDWEEMENASYRWRYVKLRLKLASNDESISPRVVMAQVKIDMPERQEKGVDVTIPSTGLTITYSSPFKEEPVVLFTLQDGAVDDRLEYVSKTASGCTVKVYNQTAAAYVERTTDYTITGFGKAI